MAWAEEMNDRSVTKTDVLRASPPMFESRVLDALSRVHPSVPVLIFLPAIAGMIAWGLSDQSLAVVIGLAIAGYALWTLFEYWLHRLVFHFEPAQGFGARLHWIIHGVHHEHPNDPRRVVLPPALSVPLALGFLGAFVLVLGTPLGWAVCAGFYAGYLIYDMTHYAVHQRRPRGRIGRRLREFHMRHHFEDDTRGFGVSAPWWDIVFRTAPRQRGAASRASRAPAAGPR
jgi:sterol desaturase/sphingolipid hydroxylase (fatty acid hydroxylase superfamily)